MASLIAAFMLLVWGCNKQLKVRSPHISPEANTWNSYDGVGSALTGIYGLLRSAMASENAFWLLGDLRNGDFTSVQRPDLQSIISGNLNASYPSLQQLLDWRRYYAVISACNLFINRSPEALVDDRYTELNNQVDIAQARVIRAYVYFYISRIWGDVPLITAPTGGLEVAFEKTPQEKVLNFASTEIMAVINGLPFSYGLSSDPVFPGNYYSYGVDYYRNTLVNRVFAYTILAHIAAWQGKYNDTEVFTKYVLDNAAKVGSTLISDITQLTNGNGFFNGRADSRQLFTLTMEAAVKESGMSGIGHLESLTLAAPLVTKQTPDIYVSKDTLAVVFPIITDTRFGIDTATKLPTTNYISSFNSEYPIFSKIKVIGDGGSVTRLKVFSSSIVLDRLEEIYLLRAEAFAGLNRWNEAIDALNSIRSIRKLPNYDGGNGLPLIDAVFQERRRELMGEGWRWYDLVRYNKMVRTNPAFNQLIDQGGIYWPIAQNVLNNNPKIQQNSYWK